jgi:hypothetical protein
LINTNENTERIFLSVNFSKFYQWKYFFDIYGENLKNKELKQKKYNDFSFLLMELLLVKFICKFVGKVFTFLLYYSLY